MYKEAEELNFEKAAEIRDQITKLEKDELNIWRKQFLSQEGQEELEPL